MRMDAVVLERGATLGPHGVVLPSARLGAGVTVGPASLVMRGDSVPKSTRWQGNPIRPWEIVTGEEPARRPPRETCRQEAGIPARLRPSSIRTCPRTAISAIGCRTMNWSWSTRSPSTGCPDRRRSPPRRSTALEEFTLDFSDAMTVAKVLVNGKRRPTSACRERKLRVRLSIEAGIRRGDDESPSLPRFAAADCDRCGAISVSRS